MDNENLQNNLASEFIDYLYALHIFTSCYLKILASGSGIPVEEGKSTGIISGIAIPNQAKAS
jgi:hypothetical protein